MNILPTPRHMMPPKLNGHIKTATPDDEAVLKITSWPTLRPWTNWI